MNNKNISTYEHTYTYVTTYHRDGAGRTRKGAFEFPRGFHSGRQRTRVVPLFPPDSLSFLTTLLLTSISHSDHCTTMADPSGAAPGPGPNDVSTAILRPKKSYVSYDMYASCIFSCQFPSFPDQIVFLWTRQPQMITLVR